MADPIFENQALGRQTFIIPLTFPDLSKAATLLPRISYGGDIWELRVDLLSDSPNPTRQINLPSVEYVKAQLELLQRVSQLPILFTIRTASQGGKFPDNAEKEALILMLIAVQAGVKYIDVEIEWSASLIKKLGQLKGDTKLVASFHDWTGNIRWSNPTLREKCQLADSFGDIIKLSILSADIYDAHELALFIRDYQTSNTKPLLAVGMGPHGQLSRITSPISLVTHDAIPFPSAPGQLTLAQVNQGLHLLGELPKRSFYIIGSDPSYSSLAAMHNAGFKELGLPFSCCTHDKMRTGDSLKELLGLPDFGGAFIPDINMTQIEPLLYNIPRAAGTTGYVDTIVAEFDQSTRESTFVCGSTRCDTVGTDSHSGQPREEVLRQQAYRQFMMWTGRRPPESVMAEAVA